MVNILFQLLISIWLVLPAYVANVSPPFIKGKYPMDFRKNIKNNRIFGDGKTWEGFILGVLCGFIVGILQIYIYPYLNPYAIELGFSLPKLNLLIVFLISFGALVGDLGGSFIKRRLGFKRGVNALFLDQLDFIIGMLIFSYWFTEITIYMILIILLITPIIHRVSCMIGYWIKVKREPW